VLAVVALSATGCVLSRRAWQLGWSFTPAETFDTMNADHPGGFCDGPLPVGFTRVAACEVFAASKIPVGWIASDEARVTASKKGFQRLLLPRLPSASVFVPWAIDGDFVLDLAMALEPEATGDQPCEAAVLAVGDVTLRIADPHKQHRACEPYSFGGTPSDCGDKDAYFLYGFKLSLGQQTRPFPSRSGAYRRLVVVRRGDLTTVTIASAPQGYELIERGWSGTATGFTLRTQRCAAALGGARLLRP
jgi:hypothetical protein